MAKKANAPAMSLIEQTMLACREIKTESRAKNPRRKTEGVLSASDAEFTVSQWCKTLDPDADADEIAEHRKVCKAIGASPDSAYIFTADSYGGDSSKFFALANRAAKANGSRVGSFKIVKLGGATVGVTTSEGATALIVSKADLGALESRKKYTRPIIEEDEINNEIDGIDEPEDVADDIVIVTDPDMTTDEYDDAIAAAQDIVDNTPEGEIPSTDEYIGDKVYQCPVCGNNFFSDTEMGADEECPVCGEIADGFVLVGDIESDEGVDEGEGEDEDVLDPDDVQDDIDDDEPVEGFKRRRAESRKKVFSGYKLDEKTFNPFLKKFILENYKNSAVGMSVKSATLRGKRLRLECAIQLKSGKSLKTVIAIENFKPARQMTLAGRADKVFKVEGSSKIAPFIFKATMGADKVIRATGFNYSYRTKKENKLVQVSGKYALKESRYPAKKREDYDPFDKGTAGQLRSKIYDIYSDYYDTLGDKIEDILRKYGSELDSTSDLFDGMSVKQLQAAYSVIKRLV